MLFLGLLMASVAVGALTGAFEGDSGESGKDLAVDDVDKTQNGGAGDDTLTGSAAHDLIGGDDGNDDITGRGGDDLLFGGDGDDLLKGRAGQDFMVGGDGDDNLRGGQDSDTVLGSAGNDTLMGGEGDDFLSGADVTNRDLTDTDYLQDPDTLPPYFYQVPTEPEANVLFGDNGNDILLLGESDTGTGGAGSDMFDIGEWIDDPENAPLITDFTSGEDLLVVRHPSDVAAPAVGLENAGQKEWHLTANGEVIARIQLDGAPPPQASDIIFLAVE